jgi:transglutaminase-like putative cysteine protease
MKCIVTSILLFVAIVASAQPGINKSPQPLWVKVYSYSEIASDTAQSSDGYAYLLISVQNHLEAKEYYRKYVIKVTSEKGLSFASSINESFDPSYQKLTFHQLNIIRKGKTIDKLDPRKFEVLRREEEMDRAVYDKSLNAVYNLPDVRVGDVVEYSFTVKGSNPVFKDHSFGMFYIQYGVPVARFANRIVYNEKKLLQFKSFGDTGTAEQGQMAGELTYKEWVRDNVPALLTDDQLPGWYDPYARVQYSDFQSWQEVKAWATALFEVKNINSDALKNEIARIRNSGKSDEEKVKACIRVAQSDIRYLSFSDGIHGYKPHAPDLVYEQKYGDCKDKSFLLAYMLNSIGVKSHPALVATDNGYRLNDILPYPYAFNHCIVQFNLHDSTYWNDPTLNTQVGPLKNYHFPSYHNALVIDRENSGLTEIPFGYKHSSIYIREEYSMDEVGGYVTLKVESEYHGDEADEIRSSINASTKDEIHKSYLNFYAKDFSEISLKKDFEFKDDTVNNVFTSWEEYVLKNFWTTDKKNKTATIYASLLAINLRKPETRLRTMPLAITHPRDITQTIKIYLPEEWEIEDTNTSIESDGFTYHGSKFYANNTITMRYNYKTKARFVEADKTAEHLAKLDEALADNGLTIYKPLNGSSDGNQSGRSMIVVLLIVGVSVYFVSRRFRR